MKIAISTSLAAKWNMNINTGHTGCKDGALIFKLGAIKLVATTRLWVSGFRLYSPAISGMCHVPPLSGAGEALGICYWAFLGVCVLLTDSADVHR